MSVTTVPLQPVGVTGLVLFWLGIVALLAIAIGYALVQTTDISLTVIEEGTGPSPTLQDIALVKYEGRLDDGAMFDSSERTPFPVAQLVPGMSKAIQKMQKGGKYKLVIPPRLGYGNREAGPIPANSTLHFDIELIDFRSASEVRAMQQAAQIQQQAMQGIRAP